MGVPDSWTATAGRAVCARSATRSSRMAFTAAMFVSGCLSAALSHQPDVQTILAGGLATIPRGSRLTETVHSVVAWYGNSGDWNATCERIEERYNHLHYADQIKNLAMVTLALRHRRSGLQKTITTAVMAGADVELQ